MNRLWLLRAAKVRALPMWWVVRSVAVRGHILADVEWWAICIDDADLSELDSYERFAYLCSALPEFRSLIHFRLRRELPWMALQLLKLFYAPAPALLLNIDKLGPGFFIQHGNGTAIAAKAIGKNCWVNQQVTIGHNKFGKPTLGDGVRVAAGAVVIGPITLHDGATVGPNATVIDDVAAGVTVVAPTAIPLARRRHDGERGAEPNTRSE